VNREAVMGNRQDGYTVNPFPKARHVYVDTLYLGQRKHTVHGLIEVDVTKARRFIREHKVRTGETLSFTAFVLTCLGKAVDANRIVHAYRNWRNQLVLFDEVDVTTMFEIEVEGTKLPLAHVIKAANKRSFRDVHDEIRGLQAERKRDTSMPYGRLVALYPLVPAFIRRFLYRVLLRSPHVMKEHIGTVILTAVGMFGQGSGWAITHPIHTLGIALGGIGQKPVVVDGQMEVREYLSVTLSFDHDIIDGGPAARFTQQLKELVEAGYGLIEDGAATQATEPLA
jgi:pyruvate/2-oxoglutarate dehydrogenase complex dihydrolipoamide acyltransferase (E2) component